MKYKNGEEVKENDICFYTEGVKWRYADGLYKIEMINGTLRPRCYVYSKIEDVFQNYIEKDNNTVELHYYANSDDICEDLYKIGESPVNDYMLSEDYITKNIEQLRNLWQQQEKGQ